MAHATGQHGQPEQYVQEAHGDSLMTYFMVFAALMVLLVITIVVAFFHFGVWNPIIALTIAFIKALLVIMFFMHMRHSTHLTWVLFGATLFFLGLLMAAIVADVSTRNWAGETGIEMLPGPFEHLMLDEAPAPTAPATITDAPSGTP